MAFHTVPVDAASVVDGGKPITFMISDFEFYTAAYLEVHYSNTHTATYVNILFYFTKGGYTFTSYMFAAILYSPFYLVQAAARI